MENKTIIEITKVLKFEFDETQKYSEGALIASISRELCKVFEKDNPKFDGLKFRKAIFGDIANKEYKTDN